MPNQIFTAPDLQRLLAVGAQLVEVLPAEEYAEQHIPGAIHIPLRDISAEAKERIDRDRPVIVYCWDVACDLSPRAAVILEDVGFEDVTDYVTGKLDWLARGLPTEGTKAQAPTAGTVARRDVPTCGPREVLRDVAARADGGDLCVVVNDEGVVFGLLSGAEIAKATDAPAEDAMRRGPSTYRPNVPIKEMAERMVEHDLATAIVSTLEGVLIGVLYRDDAVSAAGE